MFTSIVRPSVLAAALVLVGAALGDPPQETIHTALGLAIHEDQLVISNQDLKWAWINKPGGTLISIEGDRFLRHDQDGVIRLVGAKEIGDGCYWYLKPVACDSKQVGPVCQRFALTPRDSKLDGWGMTFFRGRLCLAANTESRPLFQIRFHVEPAPEPLDEVDCR